MHNTLDSEDKQPQHKAAHDVGLEGALVELPEALLERRPAEVQRPGAHVVDAHATVCAHFYRVVDYIILLDDNRVFYDFLLYIYCKVFEV